MEKITSILKRSSQLHEAILQNEGLVRSIKALSQKMIEACRRGKKIFFCGNGGSAADAQHLAAELTGRFYFDRPPLRAEALHTNSSALTAIANDYSYESVYARLITAGGTPGDVLIAISTSGNSPNILAALAEAQKMEMITAGFTGIGGGKMKECCHHLIEIPSKDTPRIQEAHILVGHILCELVESALFSHET